MTILSFAPSHVGRAPPPILGIESGKTASSTKETYRSTDSVTLSQEARELGEARASDLTPAQSARAKLDADYAKARAEGSYVVADNAHGGRHLNVSDLTDEELAAVKLNAGGLFERNEGQTAAGELGERVRVTLAPLALAAAQDPRAYQSAVQNAYKAMSPAVRDALGWDQGMIDASERLLEGAERELGELDQKSLLQKFIDHLKALRAKGRERPLDLNLDRLKVDDPIPSSAKPNGGTGAASGQLVDRTV